MIAHLPLWLRCIFGAPRQRFRSATGANLQARDLIDRRLIVRNHRQILIVVSGKE